MNRPNEDFRVLNNLFLDTKQLTEALSNIIGLTQLPGLYVLNTADPTAATKMSQLLCDTDGKVALTNQHLLNSH